MGHDRSDQQFKAMTPALLPLHQLKADQVCGEALLSFSTHCPSPHFLVLWPQWSFSILLLLQPYSIRFLLWFWLCFLVHRRNTSSHLISARQVVFT